MAKSSEPARLSTAQLEVMNVVWDRGDATITDVWQELRSRRRMARATVQTVINRLEAKGWLRYRKVGNAFLYSAVYSRDATRERLIKEFVESAFGGSAEGLVWALLRGQGVSEEQAKRIQKMIDEATRKKQRRSKKR